ncbi:protein germ cell-less isoform X1 [Neodiprion virginianus]|uniref:protein germ cell-less isoform X1 n=1 Tax=Neodiprion fabricii TaxID=2872261 RepID=UPI001ED97B86|nr:protein germ cell-less isoform X1 [Neodiprion fabricii]XP_046612113.1 protein germ cell-less isoform X1 [Neodiprion virginianus]
MGVYASRIASVSNIAVNSVYRTRKRKCIEEDEFDPDSEFIDRTLQTPKKRKLLTTAQYIYKTLFQEEKGSDVTVLMLGKAWRLHKVYITQSPYFASMFSGSWREANEKVISVEITDPNITLDSLGTVLGSLYLDELSLEPRDVISILATATLFQLQSLIDQCTEIMVETTNIKTVVAYHNAAACYGVPAVKRAAKRWLEVNLLGYGWLHPEFLNEITPDLMVELIISPDLVVMQTEFCIYMMLRIWLFVHLQKKEEVVQIEEFYKNHTWSEPFLITEEGRAYAAPFKSLRMKHLLLHHQDVKILYGDNLIPPEWLNTAYKEQWHHLLRIDSNKDCGIYFHFRPRQMSEEEFSRECFRCGRCVEKGGEHIWRWTAFHFGLDLVASLDTTTLRLKRNHRIETEHIQSNHAKHNVIVKVSLVSLDEQRQVKHIQNSGMLRLSLHKNEEKLVMSLDKQLTYPLYISVNMQVVTPFAPTEELKPQQQEEPETVLILSDT